MPRRKLRLTEAAQSQLVLWIDHALGAVNRADFISHFKISGFKQTTFNANIGQSGRFTEQQAREICAALHRPADILVAAENPEGPGAVDTPAGSDRCSHHCALFHAVNAATCDDPIQVEARRLSTSRVWGRYKLVYRFISREDRVYEVEFRRCRCGATLFDYVQDSDPIPLSSHGFALCVGEMLSIFMIGESTHWTLACHVPRQLTKRPLTGIILDPNPRRSQIEANKFVMVKLDTPIALALTDAQIAALLDNEPDTVNGALIAARE